MAMQGPRRTLPTVPPKPENRPPKPAPKPKVYRDPKTGFIVRAVTPAGEVRAVEAVRPDEQPIGRRRTTSFTSKVTSEPADSPTKHDDTLPVSQPDTVVRRKQRNMFLPMQPPASDRPVSIYEPGLVQMLKPKDESRSPEPPPEDVVFATVGPSTAPIAIKKPLTHSASAPISAKKSMRSPSGTPDTQPASKTWRSRLTLFKNRLVSSKTSLSEEQATIATTLKDHLNLQHKSDVLHYIEGLNDDNDDPAYETASTGSSEASTPVGSPEASSMLSSLDPSEPQERLSRSSRHTAIFDFFQKSSPICLAIENQWGVAAQKLPVWEQERIQAHCSFYLHTSPTLPDDDGDVSLLLQSYLTIYVSAFGELFPKTCEALNLEPPVWNQDAVKALQSDDQAVCDSEEAEDVVAEILEYAQSAEKALMEPLVDSTIINTLDYTSRSNSYLHKIDRAGELCTQLSAVKSDLPDNLVHALQEDIEALQQRLQQAATVALQFGRNDFRNAENWNQCIEIMRLTACMYLDSNLTGDKLTKAHQKLAAWFEKQQYPAAGIAKFIEELEVRERELLKILNINKKNFDPLRFQVLTQQQPQVRTKELYYLFEGLYHMVKVSHTPPACLTFGKDVEGDKDPLTLNGRFIPSCQRDADRAVNMSVTHVTMEGKDIMKEVRVGVPFAFAVPGKTAQRETTLQRFRDILTVCGMTFFEEQMLSCFHTVGTQPKPPMKLSVINVNLLSPDNLRPAFSSIPGIDNERLWCHKLEKRIGELNGRPLVLPVRRKDGLEGTVTVLPEILMVVCPCNQLAYASSMQFTNTWENADKYNQKTFMRLFGTLNPDEPMPDESYVQTFLREHTDLDPLIRKELLELCHLILYIFSNKIHHKLGDQPFIFTTCISELGRVMNMAIVSGCKSAKDRTGNYERSNIETALRLHLVRKGMAARIQKRYGEKYGEAVSGSTEQILPPIDRRMTTEDFYNNVMTLLCTGQVEVTMECLGKPGFKIPDYMLGNFIKEVYPTVNGYLSADPKTTKDSAADGIKA